jgi:hypothetical protein
LAISGRQNNPQLSIPFFLFTIRKLKDVVKDLLVGLSIQETGTAHSSVEDALAALALYKKARPEWESYISWKLREERYSIYMIYSPNAPHLQTQWNNSNWEIA